MKRHPSLVPLSRDHHQQLLLARLLRADAPPFKGLPTIKEEKRQYAVEQFRSHIVPHLDKEEELLELVQKQADDELCDLIATQRKFQKEIKKNFEALTIESLDLAGRQLEKAIRHEERLLFQSLQEKIDLDSLGFNY